jgi:hypothetical protein
MMMKLNFNCAAPRFALTAAALQERVQEFKRNADKEVQGAPPSDTFAKRLCEAVGRLTPRGFRASESEQPSDESFAQKLDRAVGEKVKANPHSQENARENAEREKSRYREPTQQSD